MVRSSMVLWSLLMLNVYYCTAMDYPGGWVLPDKTQCVNICPPPSINSRHFARASRVQKNQPGDWDYALVEQMFLPQYCRELDNGVDITLSHQNVQPYPAGLRCSPVVPSNLTIHGLWFDYFEGFPACCPYTEADNNVPYDPFGFMANNLDLFVEMSALWNDTAEQGLDSLCVLYNHEFQKHGACYSGAFTNDPIEAASIYFQATLEVTQRVQNATDQINLWALKQIPVSVQQIQQLYPKKIQLLCSSSKPVNQLSVVHTCWSKTPELTVGPMMDCPPPFISPMFAECDPTQDVTLTKYTPPSLVVAPMNAK